MDKYCILNFNKYNEPIINVEFIPDHNGLSSEIIFFTKYNIFKLLARGDCCSTSHFKIFDDNFDVIIGNIIKTIKEIKLPENYIINRDDGNFILSPHLYEIYFKNSENTFKFLLYNYSNGYYNGYIETLII